MTDLDLELARLQWEYYQKELTSHHWMRKVKYYSATNEIASAHYECVDCKSTIVKTDFISSFWNVDCRYAKTNKEGIGYLFWPCGQMIKISNPIECDSLLVKDILT